MSEETDEQRAVRRMMEWLRSSSPPPTRTMDMDGGLPTFREGTIDPDSPFADRLVALIARIDGSLESMGGPPASKGRWRDSQRWGSRQTEELRDLATTLGNASAWAQATLGETDINRKLHLALQAGWEACAARAIDTLGEYARAGRASITTGREAGEDQRHEAHDQIVEGMKRRIADRHTVADAARIVYEVDGLGTSAEANRGLWRRHTERSRKEPMSVTKRKKMDAPGPSKRDR